MRTTATTHSKFLSALRKILPLLAAVVLAFGLSLSTSARADGWHRGGHEHEGWHHGRVERHWGRWHGDGDREWHRGWARPYGWWGYHHGYYRGCSYWTPYGYRYDPDCDGW